MECEKKILGIFPFKAGSQKEFYRQLKKEYLQVSISSQSSFRVKLKHKTPGDEEEMPAIISAEHSWESATLE